MSSLRANICEHSARISRSERDSIPKSPSNATAFGMSNSASSSSTPIAESIADVSASVWGAYGVPLVPAHRCVPPCSWSFSRSFTGR